MAVKALVKKLLHTAFMTGQQFKLDILPRHFYSSIPDFRELRRDTSWKRPTSMYGIAGSDLEGQLAFAAECCGAGRGTQAYESRIHAVACEQNQAEGFGRVEANFLFCFIIHIRPRKIIQAGSGVSTSVILQAAAVAGYEPEIVCIDPYPTGYLERLSQQGKIRLIAKRAQDVALEDLTALAVNDLFFVDSTHTVKPGSEVNRIILEVMPRLPSGCFVHFHDINFPYDYQSDLMKTLFFWGETSLLHAFLTDNKRYRIAVATSMLHYGKPRELGALLPDYRPALMDHGLRVSPEHPFDKHIPTSVYLEVTS
jgi:hypothetical protein